MLAMRRREIRDDLALEKLRERNRQREENRRFLLLVLLMFGGVLAFLFVVAGSMFLVALLASLILGIELPI